MGKKRREGSDSRCCRPEDGPYVWRDYRDPTRQAAVDFETWLQGLAPFARAHQEGENEDLLEAAARGELKDSGDETTAIKPIVANPEIYELRRTALSKKLRFYHGEPSELALMLVALHRHMKVDGTPQQPEIEFAAARYIQGRPSSWV
ncbi:MULTISPECIES: hypothetical protein [unclassified Frigoribacterium]|uniref:hypothetical protein n=1 Tax=unclassified Frigoribacterium TaxID=2627005 RepID=UPI0009EA045B|nr:MULTISPECIES: hypothetical protein [unclassified Frigoribacterium]